MRLRTRARQDPRGDVPVTGDALMPPDPAVPSWLGDLELPAPGRLALTAGWNLAESLGLPLIAYVVGEQLGGQGLGMAAAAVMVWLTAAARKVLTGSVPGLLVITTGSVLIFLLQFPTANLALCILFARTAPTGRPLAAQLAAEVVALRQPSAAHPGLARFFRGVTWLWAAIFAASAIGLGVLLAVEPTPVFLLLTTVVTVVGVAAGTLASVLWFMRMLRQCSLRVRFGQA